MNNAFVALALLPCLILSLCSCGDDKTEPDYFNYHENIIPKPVSQVYGEGYFILSGHTAVISDEGREDLAIYLSEEIGKLMAFAQGGSKKNRIILQVTEQDHTPESYTMEVTPEKIIITGADRAGLFYGIQTLRQMLPPEIYSGKGVENPIGIPVQTITDRPAFGYRGFMLDIARTFSDKETVIRLLDRMAAHKMNKFHWHLADDEGWRILLDSYPELALQGGFRGGDSPVGAIYGQWESKYGDYYTKEEIREIIEYAAFRNIEVIPEIDLPGHSRTAARVYPEILCAGAPHTAASAGYDLRNVWCAAKENNYDMLGEIISEIAELFPSRFLHIGGDEVMLGQWRNCPDCRKVMQQQGYSDAIQLEDYFISKVSDIVRENGKTPFVWDEATLRGKPLEDTHVSAWQSPAKTLAVLKKGYKTVVMPGSYFYIDMRQSPYETGQVWAGVVNTRRIYNFSFTDNGIDEAAMENVVGVEGTYFSEILLSQGPEFLDYQLFPRISALSEVAWTAESEREWDDFYRRLTSAHLYRLSEMGIGYRLFPPDVRLEEGKMIAVKPFDDVQIRYTTDGTIPTFFDPLYDTVIAFDPGMEYKFRAFYRNSASPAVDPAYKHTATIGAKATRTFSFPVSEITDHPGLWYLVIRPDDNRMKINRITIDANGRTSTIIGSVHNMNEFHKFRIYAGAGNKDGVINVTMKNENDFDCGITFELTRSPYIEPAVKVTSSMKESERFLFRNAEDYNFTSYVRTSGTCEKGDHITFTFNNPVDASSIEVATGLYYMARYNMLSGKVYTSVDGINFTETTDLEGGTAILHPEGKIKAIKLVSDRDGNYENAVAIQDLKIKPRKN